MPNIETIEIRQTEFLDGRKTLRARHLYVDNCLRASTTEQRDGRWNFHFYPIGPFSMSESKIWLQGCLELLMVAEEFQHDQKKRK